jgi:hypothetical protein
MCRRSRLFSTNPVSSAFIFPVVLYSVIITLQRNVIFRFVGITVSLKAVPMLRLYLEVFSSKLSCTQNNQLHFRLQHLKLTHFTLYTLMKCRGHSHRRSKRKMRIASCTLIPVPEQLFCPTWICFQLAAK